MNEFTIDSMFASKYREALKQLEEKPLPEPSEESETQQIADPVIEKTPMDQEQEEMKRRRALEEALQKKKPQKKKLKI